VSDDVKALSTELARDPQSLVFLRLGEVLRQKRQFDAAARIALHGLERHPHLADAHDLYARILADRHNYEQAFDEWDMTLRIAPQHTGALKGLAFLYFKVGDVAQAEAHLQTASHIAPDDPSIAQAFAVIRGEPGVTPPGGQEPEGRIDPVSEREATSEPARLVTQLPDERIFAGLEGAQEGLLLLDAAGLVLGGALKTPDGVDVTDTVAAYLAGVSQEAARTARLLGMGGWRGLSAEGQGGHVYVAQPTSESMLLMVRDRSVPLGRLGMLAQRAAQVARSWLERQR
jgi:predicted regulator of Ras-like GTPase activity (Roadblock/LC7/MglB family)